MVLHQVVLVRVNVNRMAITVHYNGWLFCNLVWGTHDYFNLLPPYTLILLNAILKSICRFGSVVIIFIGKTLDLVYEFCYPSHSLYGKWPDIFLRGCTQFSNGAGYSLDLSNKIHESNTCVR